MEAVGEILTENSHTREFDSLDAGTFEQRN